MADSAMKRDLVLREILEELFPNVALSQTGVILLAAEIASLEDIEIRFAPTINPLLEARTFNTQSKNWALN